ncbi:unnamed protein product [Dovyalis caffra]|uniref:RING-type E3 ubiquitin transferase n=1 Tax=Dovyalis caffra TaxID=77055 RepID=A0AAV1SGK8_9ROSI|nr:unnamed protein product [Dovyalis caffra]
MEPARALKSSSFLKKASPPLNPPKPHKFPFTPFHIFLTFLPLTTLAISTPTTIKPSNFLEFYAKHCHSVVPESPITGTIINNASLFETKTKILNFDVAYFTGGSQIIPKKPDSDSPPNFLTFKRKRLSLHQTENPFVVSLQGSLRFRFPVGFHWNNITRNRKNLKRIRYRPPRIPVNSRYLVFELYGFWSMNSGKLCMVGSGSSNSGVSSLNAVFKVNYPVGLSDFRVLINGVLESLDFQGSFGYFEPVSILGIPHFGEYKYALVDKESGNMGFSENDDSVAESENLPIESIDRSTCLNEMYWHTRILELEYGSDCSGVIGGKCNPFSGSFEVLPKIMTIQGIRCDHEHEHEHEREARVLIGFLNSAFVNGYGPYGSEKVFDPNTMLIGEGVWDEKRNRLFVVACRVLNFNVSLANATVGDCSVQLTLRFPRTLTIRDQSVVVGQISSNKTVNDTGYFRRIGFHGSEFEVRRLPGLNYEYTMLDKAHKSCAEKKSMKAKGKTYPYGYSSDMRFDMLVRNGKGNVAQGFSTPMFVGDRLFEPYLMTSNYSGPLNISYKMVFTDFYNSKLGMLPSKESGTISAEGTYDNEIGVLCMIGCRYLISHMGISAKNDSTDCDVLVNVQFSPLNGKGQGNIKGTVESIREKSDPLYFEKLKISSNSIYRHQAVESIWRMDMEITMVLISNTLACIFMGLQLYHVKKHPDVLPMISFMMLLVLTLGHMIPLLLNFEALFVSNRNQQNVFLESGGWLEVNEVAVRVVKMVAFLLIFWLLQLTWSARQIDGSHKSLWLSEKRVLYWSFPVYIFGGLIAWYVHNWKNTYRSSHLLRGHKVYQGNHPWTDLKSYAGLIMDGFLLPQIMFNLFLNSRENTLASSFYVGTTIIRLLPHAYDLYRVHSSAWYLDLSYLYANHTRDFYSTAWDIIIPLCGLLFATLVYLQQRFGGHCILPKRFRGGSEYEKVPIVSSEELQEIGTH